MKTSRSIPFVDLRKQYQSIKPEIDAAIQRVLDSAQFVLGPEVAAFEKEFAEFSNATYGIGVNSGTSALHLALLAAGVGPGDEVITVPFTFVASVASIRYAGAHPVFVDIHPQSFTMDPALVERAITNRTKAIMPVHLYGQCADMDPIQDIAKRHGLVVIEDAAQAHGAEYRGRRAGTLGDMACFSFYAGKSLGAFGEGGMVVTNSATYAEKIRLMRNWGESKRYYHDVIGFNYRLEAIQAAVLRVKLRHLNHWNDHRRACAALYSEELADSGVNTLVEMPYGRSVYQCFVIQTKERQALIDALSATGIQTRIHYPVPIHLQPAYADLGYTAGQFPVAESAARHVLSLPMHGELTREEVQTVADLVRTSRSQPALA